MLLLTNVVNGDAMNEIIQPLISIPTTDTQMFFVGLLEFILCTAFVYLIFRSCERFTYQCRFVKFVIIINILAWISLISVGLFVVPNEIEGSYLDVYANLALANIGFMMVVASACVLLLLSKPKLGMVVTLIFGAIFGPIGGKGIGDFLSPKPMHAQISWLSFDTVDKRLSSLRMGLVDIDYQQLVSIKLARELQHTGALRDIDFSDHHELVPPIRMDLVQAPYSDMVYLPSDYAFSNFGKKLFYSLLCLWGAILLTTLLMLLMVTPRPNPPLKA